MEIIYILLRAIVAVATVVALTRLNGLRSFSKMSGFDFAITVAVGSVLASTVIAATPRDFWTNVGVLVAFFLVQGVLARIRTASRTVRDVIGNDPLLLMRDGRFLKDNMTKGQISRGDLIAKLREANALRLDEVHAVVLEATGDISVLHGGTEFDETILEGVRT
ncbi:DUF421 domain-containing protein [Salipiger sp. IMCC34102]|uniref:DUF421 domain-containing protein n=1 Tax=Salipiger sp. IMCC34102 TaxID=2510647 RepID=UPI00101BC56D|nr:YetF domain-containing protein [Salipiger sp. IMCC34102]RYH00974.1 DUF421 domain-containing protein [Salipiger sp. IMCC34102]